MDVRLTRAWHGVDASAPRHPVLILGDLLGTLHVSLACAVAALITSAAKGDFALSFYRVS